MRSVPLAPAEERVLRKLSKDGPSSVGAARAAAARLVELGLVAESSPDKKKRNSATRMELTAAGWREAERLPPERITPAVLYREIVALRERLDALVDALQAGASTSPVGAPRGDGEPSVESVRRDQPVDAVRREQPVDAGTFDRELQRALRELDRRGRHGGLVPIPELRRALVPLGMSRRAFDEALLDRERAFVVDLKVAHDARQLADAAEGVSEPARGLLYYAVLR